MPVMKVSWITSPFALAFAQKFLPEQMWVPFFNIIAFIIGTYVNAHTKKKRLAALRKKVQCYTCVYQETPTSLTLAFSMTTIEGAPVTIHGQTTRGPTSRCSTLVFTSYMSRMDIGLVNGSGV